MALTSFRPRRGTRLTGSTFQGEDPDDPKKRRGRKGRNFRQKAPRLDPLRNVPPELIRRGDPERQTATVGPGGNLQRVPEFREEQPDASRFNPRDPDQPNALSSALSNFRMAVDPTQEGFADRGIPGLVTGLVEDIQRNPVPWAPYAGDAIGYKEGAEMAGEGHAEGSLLKELGGAGIQGLSMLGMGELGRPLARALRAMGDNPELIGTVAAGLRRKPLQGAAPDPAQEVLELGDPRVTRTVPEGEEGLIETGDMPGRLFSRTARAVELGPDEAPAAEWLQRLTGEETSQFTMPERGLEGTATTRRSRAQPDVPQREVRNFGLADALEGGDPQRPVSKQELLQRIDDRMPPMTEEVFDDDAIEYVIPGGDNYRAIAIGLDTEALQQGLAPRLARRLADGDEIPVGGGTLKRDGNDVVLITSDGRVAGIVDNTEEGVAQLIRESPEGSLLPPGASVHIGDRGTMLHVRMQDQDVYDGIKTLSVEEIQSDLFQQARRSKTATGNPMENTADWTAIGVRRAFREAMDGDYQRLTFPTGEQIMAVPNMGADSRVAAFYDKEVDRQVRRVAKELGLDPPRRGHIYEGGMSDEARDEAVSEAIDEIVGEWDPDYAVDGATTRYQESILEDIDEHVDDVMINERLDRDEYINFDDGSFDQDSWDQDVIDLKEQYAEDAAQDANISAPAEWEVREAAMNYENFSRWMENNYEEFAIYGDTSELEDIFQRAQGAFESPEDYIDDFGSGEQFETLILDLPQRPKPFEQLDAEIAERQIGTANSGGRRVEGYAPDAPDRQRRRLSGVDDRRREGARRADPQGEGIYEGAERRATNNLDRRAVARAREMAGGVDKDPVQLLREALMEQESKKPISKYEQARKVGMRLSALVGATAVGSQAMERRREGTR